MPEKIASAHRILWLTVIGRALDDYKAGKERKQYFSSEYFGLICERAGVSPQDIIKVL